MDRTLRPVLGMLLVSLLTACAPQPAPAVLAAPNHPTPREQGETSFLPIDSSNPPAMPLTPLASTTIPSPHEQQAAVVDPFPPMPATFPTTNPAAAPKATRAYLGIVPDQSAKASNVGVLVQGTQPGSPAALADVRAGDLIIKFDGQPISNLDQLGRVLDLSQAGQSVALTVLRGASSLQLTVRLAQPPGRS